MFERIGEHVYIKAPEGYSDRPTIGYIKGDAFSLLFEAGASEHHVQDIKRDLEEMNLPPSLSCGCLPLALGPLFWT